MIEKGILKPYEWREKSTVEGSDDSSWTNQRLICVCPGLSSASTPSESPPPILPRLACYLSPYYSLPTPLGSPPLFRFALINPIWFVTWKEENARNFFKETKKARCLLLDTVPPIQPCRALRMFFCSAASAASFIGYCHEKADTSYMSTDTFKAWYFRLPDLENEEPLERESEEQTSKVVGGERGMMIMVAYNSGSYSGSYY